MDYNSNGDSSRPSEITRTLLGESTFEYFSHFACHRLRENIMICIF